MSDWSERGCTKSNKSTAKRVVCECTHLTNFGVLMVNTIFEIMYYDE